MSSQASRYKNKPLINCQDFTTSVLIKGKIWTMPDERYVVSYHKNGVPKKIFVKNINVSGIKIKEAFVFVSSSGKIETITSKSKKLIIDIFTNGKIFIKHRPIKLKEPLLFLNA